MSNIFMTNDAMFARAAQMADDTLDAYLAGTVEMAIFPTVEDARKALDEAMTARRAAQMASIQGQAVEAMKAMWDAFTMPKSMTKVLLAMGDVAADAEMERGAMVALFVKRDAETGEMTISSRVVDVRRKDAAPKSRASSGGKAMLDGKPLTAKLLRDEYPDSFARKALDNPHAADPARWGEKTRLNATQAVKADAILCERLTFVS